MSTWLTVIEEFINLGAKNSPTPGQRASSTKVHRNNLQANALLGFSGLYVWPEMLEQAQDQELLHHF